MRVVVKMKDGWDEETVKRLRSMGLVTEHLLSGMGMVIGTIEDSRWAELRASPDIALIHID